MYPVDPTALVQVLTEDRLREADRTRLARQLRRERTTAARADRPAASHPRLAGLLHLRHAYR